MLTELKNQHREIARLVFEGHKPPDIAIRMNLAIATIRGILADHMFKAYVANLNDRADTSVIDVRKRLAEMNEDALDRMHDMVKSASDVPHTTVLKAAESILDRNGYKAPDRVEHIHGHFTKEDIEELKRRGQAAAQVQQGTDCVAGSNTIIDVTPSETKSANAA